MKKWKVEELGDKFVVTRTTIFGNRKYVGISGDYIWTLPIDLRWILFSSKDTATFVCELFNK